MSEISAAPRPQGDAFVPVAGAATDVGRLRPVNEDGYLALAPAFVVVDGMGGHAAGRLRADEKNGPAKRWKPGQPGL